MQWERTAPHVDTCVQDGERKVCTPESDGLFVCVCVICSQSRHHRHSKEKTPLGFLLTLSLYNPWKRFATVWRNPFAFQPSSLTNASSAAALPAMHVWELVVIRAIKGSPTMKQFVHFTTAWYISDQFSLLPNKLQKKNQISLVSLWVYVWMKWTILFVGRLLEMSTTLEKVNVIILFTAHITYSCFFITHYNGLKVKSAVISVA